VLFHYYLLMLPRIEYIMAKFKPKLDQKALMDRLVRTAGVAAGVVIILVPELAVMLIKEAWGAWRTWRR
jgi:hypothetical protein